MILLLVKLSMPRLPDQSKSNLSLVPTKQQTNFFAWVHSLTSWLRIPAGFVLISCAESVQCALEGGRHESVTLACAYITTYDVAHGKENPEMDEQGQSTRVRAEIGASRHVKRACMCDVLPFLFVDFLSPVIRHISSPKNSET